MKTRTLIALILAVLMLTAIGCSPQPTEKKPGETKATKADKTDKADKPKEKPVPKFDKETEDMFKTLSEKYKPEDNFFWEKEFTVLKETAKTKAKNKDKVFLEQLFIAAEYGKPVQKKAANELLTYVVSEYTSGEWDEQDKYRAKAIKVITTHPDKEYRKGCWGFLTYYYEPKKVTPKVLEAYKKTDDVDLKVEMLENIQSPASGAFIDGNEEELNKIGLEVLKDDKAPVKLKVAAMKVLGETGEKNDEVKKELEKMKESSDDKLKSAAESALKELKD